MSIEKRIFGGNPPENVLKKLSLLQQSGSVAPLNSVNPNYDEYLGGRTPFARMWTATQITPSGSKESKVVFHSVNENRGFNYEEPLAPIASSQYQRQNISNQFLKPTAGITSVSSKSEGALGALRSTNVEFEVHNKRDFEEIFLPFFLRPGAMVCVDFGWSSHRFKLYDPEKMISDGTITMEKFDTDIKRKVHDNLGELEVVVGTVRKYDASITELGSFKCSLEMVSRNYSLLDAEITDDNNLKYVFANMLEDIIIKALTLNFEGSDDILAKYDNSYRNPLSSIDYSTAKDAFFDTLTDPTLMGVLSKKDIKRGIYFQDILDEHYFGYKIEKSDTENEVGEEEESLYICYGLFEDLFLNNFVRSVVTKKDGERVSKTPDEKLSFGFDSSKSRIRWSSDLYKIQTQPLMKGEKLPSFLLPNLDGWEISYNGEPNPTFESDKADEVIPIRELFIKTSLLSEGFRKKQNVNDALEHIWETINSESQNVWKIKMASPKKMMHSESKDKEIALIDVGSQIGFYDINKAVNDEIKFTFDVTSGNGFVKNFDLKFQTPKAGMASMLAISNSGFDNLYFDEGALKELNLLKVLGPKFEGKDAFFKSLPDLGDANSDLDIYTSISIDFETLKPLQKSFSDDPNLVDAFEAYNKTVEDLQRGMSGGRNETGSSDALPLEPDEDEKDKKIITANSPREYYVNLAKRNNMFEQKDTSISPVLPIELSISAYGNNLLQIGDIVNVNYLPKNYKDRIYFQIMGIDHKVGTSGWDVTYNTIMRIKPTKIDKVQMDKDDIIIKLSLDYSRTVQNDLFEEFRNGIVNTTKIDEFEGFDILLNTFNGTPDNSNKPNYKYLTNTFQLPKTSEDIAFVYALQNRILSEEFVKYKDKNLNIHNVSDRLSKKPFHPFTQVQNKNSINFYHDATLWIANFIEPKRFGMGRGKSEAEEEIFQLLKKVNFSDVADYIKNDSKFSDDGVVNPIFDMAFDMSGGKFKYYSFMPKTYKQNSVSSINIPLLTQHMEFNPNYKDFLTKIKEDYNKNLKLIKELITDKKAGKGKADSIKDDETRVAP